MSVTQMAFKCGYGTPAHFTNHFKKLTVFTPLQYQLHNHQFHYRSLII